MAYLTRTIEHIEQKVYLQLTSGIRVLYANTDDNKWWWFIAMPLMLESDENEEFVTLLEAIDDSLYGIQRYIREESEMYQIHEDFANISNAIEEFKRSEEYQNLKPAQWESISGYSFEKLLELADMCISTNGNVPNGYFCDGYIEWIVRQGGFATQEEAQKYAVQKLREYAIMILEQTEHLI